MSVVRIPTTLRQTTGGAKRVEVTGSTVAEIIDALVAVHPAIGTTILAEDGSISRFVNVYLDTTDIRHLDGTATAVRPDDEVVLLPAMAGG
ncbi:MAG: ubiquitin-like small modifier protein 1 [Chloroflexota bacterium]